MNKTLQTLVCLSVAAVAFSSCQKDEPATTVSIRATIADAYTSGESGAKVVVDNTVMPSFVAGDKVWVNGDEFTASVSGDEFTLEGSTEGSPYNAVYPKDFVTSTDGGFPVELTLPAEQPYTESNGQQVINAPMAATGSGEPQLEFKNVCSLVRVRVRNNMGKGDFSLSSITITATNAILSGSATINESDGNFTLAISSGTNSVTLTGLSEVVKENKSSKDYYIYIPPVSGDGTQFVVSASGTYEEHSTMNYTFKSTSSSETVTIAPSRVGAVSMLLASSEISAMHPNHYFSVSASKKVYFSLGNLQYQASTNTWRFAEEQWIALTNTETSGNLLNQTDGATTSLWIDLFGWGTSGVSDDYDYENTYYHPYDRMYNSNENIGYGYGPTGNTYNCSLTDDYDKSDWGYNAISNGGNKKQLWRTLTSSEWTYIWNRGTSLRTRATVNGVAGLVLLPDEWEKPDGVAMTTNAGTVNANVYDISTWRKLEQNGAIFLPAAGGTFNKITDETTKPTMTTPPTNGYYWSSTTSSKGNAYRWNFATTSTTNAIATTYKYYRLSVRLVQDVVE